MALTQAICNSCDDKNGDMYEPPKMVTKTVIYYIWNGVVAFDKIAILALFLKIFGKMEWQRFVVDGWSEKVKKSDKSERDPRVIQNCSFKWIKIKKN